MDLTESLTDQVVTIASNLKNKTTLTEFERMQIAVHIQKNKILARSNFLADRSSTSLEKIATEISGFVNFLKEEDKPV